MSDKLPRRWTDQDGQTWWTDQDGRTWELVHQPASYDVSDATLGGVVGMTLLVPGIALLAAHSLWRLPDWLAGPVAGALVIFGLVFLMVSLMPDGR